MIEINIDSEYIKLDQALKLADVASTGGHAKFLILEGLVKVNGEVETRRGRKLKTQDIIEVEGNTIKVV
ncbi:MAG: RNA-binding S4 domain-containing protein [Romboutsia sp.]|jgi:ribosome-associated protein|nr:RNA-binding S4 domain-containing protein [Romboutsia sp.]